MVMILATDEELLEEISYSNFDKYFRAGLVIHRADILERLKNFKGYPSTS